MKKHLKLYEYLMDSLIQNRRDATGDEIGVVLLRLFDLDQDAEYPAAFSKCHETSGVLFRRKPLAALAPSRVAHTLS
ncbi:hypothetical protein [Paracoccus alcaliphilus]|uniref:hypothetical protein n=1 Tax=Paracoccus alcaliphilus TaxID=34002 RepID=UPI0011134106|nr:hypothetical protein [Paracoccus alcaliphilus]WCR20877.1 hypothetical protein JHW40_23105 [Paracoccus alcaliphilus]